jgi:hypothetical protein
LLALRPTPTIPIDRPRVDGQLVSMRDGAVKVRWFQHWSGTSYAGDTEDERGHFHVAWWFPDHTSGTAEASAFQRRANRQRASGRCDACALNHWGNR